MNKSAILFPAALIAFAAPTYANSPVVPTAPKLQVKVTMGNLYWSARNAYYVTITPGAYGELPVSGSLKLPAGTYVLTAVGEQNRKTCMTVVIN